MTVDPQTTPHRRTAGAAAVYFCSSGCAAAFDADAGRYAAVMTANPLGSGGQ
jgi:YHS domain-containing protein